MHNKWDVRFIEMAELISTWSKDPSTKVGAVAVGEDRNILATGYNGFPAGIKDDGRLEDRPVKYSLIVHAEMNCIFNASKIGVSLKGSTMYVHGLPVCSDCAKGLIQSGVNRIVINKASHDPRWAESFEKTINMFNEAGIICDEIDLPKPVDAKSTNTRYKLKFGPIYDPIP